MANHSCICSAMYNAEFRPTSGPLKSSTPAAGQFFIELRAQNNIKRGAQISIRYLDSLLTTPQRKKASKAKWNFVCQCPRFGSVFCNFCLVAKFCLGLWIFRYLENRVFLVLASCVTFSHLKFCTKKMNSVSCFCELQKCIRLFCS